MTAGTNDPADRADAAYLRSELMMRMIVQNIVLIANVLFFLPMVMMLTGGTDTAATMALAYTIAATVLGAIWCHHGVRQAQIKRYLLRLEEKGGVRESWESWLPENRAGGFLGARWVISTKLPFVATTASACLIGFALDTTRWRMPLTIGNVLAIAVLTILLRSNPKEGPSRPNQPG